MAATTQTSSYTNIDDAFQSAQEVISQIASENTWPDEQADKALLDAKSAYDENSDFGSQAALLLDFDIWANALGNYDVLLNPSKDTLSDAKLAKAFWADLYSRAKSGWTSFPNYSKAALWLASAVEAVYVAEETSKAEAPSTIVAGGVTATATDAAAAAQTTATVLTDSRFWYGLVAVATLGAVRYLVRAFR